MDKTDEAERLVRHAQQLIEQSEDDAIKQYGAVVVTAEEILKSSNQSSEYIDKFLEEVSAIHEGKDTLLLVCLGMISKIGFEGDKTSMMPQLNDTNYGFIFSEYYAIKRAANNIRAAELFPKDDNKVSRTNTLEGMFQGYVSLTVGRFYKPGILWRQKLMWQLLKEWNSRRATAGIPGDIRKKLGEEKALELFRKVADEIMSDQNLLDKAVGDYHKLNPYAK